MSGNKKHIAARGEARLIPGVTSTGSCIAQSDRLALVFYPGKGSSGRLARCDWGKDVRFSEEGEKCRDVYCIIISLRCMRW